MLEEGLQIFPEASELSEIVNNIMCPEENCGEVFRNTPNLTLHLLKTHGKKTDTKSVYGRRVAQYYCPELGCKYHFNLDINKKSNSKFGNRFFTQFKYLKQHYIKVHLEKTFFCKKCNKAFPTELHRSRHIETCGTKYVCSCGTRYQSLTSLQTHAARKQHAYDKCYDIRGHTNRSRKSAPNNEKKDKPEEFVNTCQSILAQGTSILYLHGVVDLDKLVGCNSLQILSIGSQSVSVASQTESPVPEKRRKALSPVKSADKCAKKRTSRQTQTGDKIPKKSSETQTTGQYVVRDGGGKLKGSCRKRKKSMETQTVPPVSREIEIDEYPTRVNSRTDPDEDSMSLDDSFKKRDICLPQLWLNADNSYMNNKGMSGTDFITNDMTLKTEGSSDSILERKGEHRSLSLYSEQDTDHDKNFTSALCHIETQTDDGRNSFLDDYLANGETQTNDIMDQDTRWTQTCDDIMLPELVDFTNNETQTAWSFSYNSPLSSSNNLVHSETQTPPRVQEYSIS